MTITVELNSAVEERLRQEARRRGLETGALIKRLIEDALIAPVAENGTDEAWEADMQALSEGCEQLPVLPSEAFSRESLYDERG